MCCATQHLCCCCCHEGPLPGSQTISPGTCSAHLEKPKRGNRMWFLMRMVNCAAISARDSLGAEE